MLLSSLLWDAAAYRCVVGLITLGECEIHLICSVLAVLVKSWVSFCDSDGYFAEQIMVAFHFACW